MKVKLNLSTVLIVGAIYFLFLRRPRENVSLDYLGYSQGNQGVVVDGTTEWA